MDGAFYNPKTVDYNSGFFRKLDEIFPAIALDEG
jgi:hypothetical protein